MIVIGPIVNYMREGRVIRAAHLLSTEAGRPGRDELVSFARSIGLSASWLQKRQTPHEHFDVMGARIERAIEAGAARVNNRAIATILRKKREQLGLVRVPIRLIRARSSVREMRASRTQ